MVSAGIFFMNATTCATLANVIPIFLIALIAERSVSRRAPHASRAARLVVDFSLAALMLILEIGLLIGVENGGLNKSGVLAWIGSGALMIAVLYRWALLSPTTDDIMDAAFRASVRFLAKGIPFFRRFAKPTDEARPVNVRSLSVTANLVAPSTRRGRLIKIAARRRVT